MKDRDLWGELIEYGKRLGIYPRALTVAKPKRGRGRPLSIRVTRWSGYEGWTPGSSRRPRCMLRGCQKWLRKEEPAYCPEHIDLARELLRLTDEAAKAAAEGNPPPPSTTSKRGPK